MKPRLVSILLLITSIYLIMAVATQVIVDQFLHPRTLFANLLFATVISGLASLSIDVDLSDAGSDVGSAK